MSSSLLRLLAIKDSHKSIDYKFRTLNTEIYFIDGPLTFTTVKDAQHVAQLINRSIALLKDVA